jgi:hypothetical protein
MFFVNVASKRLKYWSKSFVCNTYEGLISVASKGLILPRNCAVVQIVAGVGEDQGLSAIVPEATVPEE